jgi:hypothetical protein
MINGGVWPDSWLTRHLRQRGVDCKHESGLTFRGEIEGGVFEGYKLLTYRSVAMNIGDAITDPTGRTFMIFGLTDEVAGQEAVINIYSHTATVQRTNPDCNAFGRPLDMITVASDVPVIIRDQRAFIPDRHGVRPGDMIQVDGRNYTVLDTLHDIGITCLLLAAPAAP